MATVIGPYLDSKDHNVFNYYNVLLTATSSSFCEDQINMCFRHLINPRHFISCTVVTSVVCCGGGGGGDGGGGGSSQQMWQSGFRICNLKGNFITCSVILFTSCLIQIQCFHCLHTDASECNFIGFPSSSCNLKISG